MLDIIQLLPDHVANQIAAGEVVQRPASLVKELLENAIDAKATSVSLVIKDAGKTLVQVIDNGIGMSVTDARFCFERHATSKIKAAEDLFNINTKGFRGEALASIAAIAHVELKTKRALDEIGTHIVIEGSKVNAQDAVVVPVGTSISVKNLFYNIPARRNFLKTNTVETRHVIDEFHRVALAHPQVAFSFINNGSTVFNLPASNMRQRIVNIFGTKTNEKLVPVSEETEIVSVEGFVVKPEFAKKGRGEQFFFVNNRFIKSPYLHHAINSAFEGLIKEGGQPGYFLFLQVDTTSIDINIHPTKTEIKFDDEHAIYAMLRASVKHSLGQFNIAPTIDFDNNINLNTPYSYRNKDASIPKVDYNQAFNPFDNLNKPVSLKTKDFEITNSKDFVKTDQFKNELEILKTNSFPSFQLKSKYIITKTSAGILIINQKRAHQRILYENFLKDLSNKTNPVQTLLFPIKLDFNSEEIRMLNLLEAPLVHLGFKFNNFGSDNIEISGIHPFLNQKNINELFQDFLRNKDYNQDSAVHTLNDLIAKLLSKYSSISSNENINVKLQESLVNDLFACKDPNISPFNKLIFKVISTEEINKIFFK
jgi:DNA mismatch repair protein MutL